jgi:hypothetical protein
MMVIPQLFQPLQVIVDLVFLFAYQTLRAS